MAIPTRSPYVVIGAGIHGLSTAYHLALQLKATGKGDGRDIIILDKSGICSGATGIACGVIRNNYFQPAMRELMAHSVNIWESDPEAFELALGSRPKVIDLVQIRLRRAVGDQYVAGHCDSAGKGWLCRIVPEFRLSA